jgi:hypothetical protein
MGVGRAGLLLALALLQNNGRFVGDSSIAAEWAISCCWLWWCGWWSTTAPSTAGNRAFTGLLPLLLHLVRMRSASCMQQHCP